MCHLITARERERAAQPYKKCHFLLGSAGYVWNKPIVLLKSIDVILKPTKCLTVFPLPPGENKMDFKEESSKIYIILGYSGERSI